MRTIALLLAAVLLPTDAMALGIGTTGYLGNDFGVIDRNWFGLDVPFGGSWLPSLDLYPSDDLVIQIHALDTLAWIVEDGSVLLGGDISFTVLRAPGLSGMDGVIQPGGSLDLYGDNGLGIVLGGQARIGMEGGDAARLGVYIVPGLGLTAGDFDEDVIWTGGLQVSYWFAGAGGGRVSGSSGAIGGGAIQP